MADEHHHHHTDGHHHHHHHHHHGRSHAPANFGRAFAIGIILNSAFVLIEGGYGFYTNSLALVADAGHNLSDVLSLLLAWGASILARRVPFGRFTYGLRSSSIVAALLNAVLLLVATGAIALESIQRFGDPRQVDGKIVIIVAGIGVLINTATAILFMSGRKHDLNVRAAFLHMAADAAISGGVVIAGVMILYTGWQWLDPAVSLLIAILIIWSSWGILRDAIGLTLHAVPQGIDAAAVRTYLQSLAGVQEVHDLHIWGMSTTETALTAHLVMPGGYPSDAFRAQVDEQLQALFGIGHATLQIELGDRQQPCKLAPDNLV